MNKPDIETTLRNEGIELKLKGKSLWGLCPFHLERTPSFKVDPERQSFYCFGCGAGGGDVIAFIQKYKNLSFRDALRYLGISGKPMRPDNKELKKRELLRKFNLWVYTKHDSLCALCRELQEIKPLVKSEEELENLAFFYHREALWIHQIEILQGRDDEAKFRLYREIKYGR
jgi:DNA primase